MMGSLRRFKDNLDQHREAVASFVRFAAITVVAVIIIIAIGEATRTHHVGRDDPSAPARNDPLAAGLARCRDVTAEQLAADDTCRRVWAENRKRFFAPSSKPAEAH